MALEVVGKRTLKYDGMSHITGQSRYVDDILIPGTLTVKAFRSPVHKGRIKSLDTSKAENMPGVAGVITFRDVPHNAYGMEPDQPVLVEKDIRYKGEPIAAFAAINEKVAYAALDRIVVDIEEEEPVFDPLRAMEPDAPKVRPEGNVYMFGSEPFKKVYIGDIDEGFRKADHIIEETYFYPDMEHSALETQVSLAVPEATGKLTIYTVSQARNFHLGMLAGILKLGGDALQCECINEWSGRTRSSWRGKTGMNRVRLEGYAVGGGFGGKNELHADHITALLALKTARPCKWRWTREEELLYSTHRGPWYVTIKDGVMNDGRIVARYVKSIHDGGAYIGFNAYAAGKFSYFVNGPYHVPNLRCEGYCVFTNKPVASTMRGFAVAPGTFAVEVQMHKIAEKLGMDPWELRFKNAILKGDQLVTRQVMKDPSLVETMQALAKRVGVTLPDHLMRMTSESHQRI
jgi:CO/xanthine dehydrogenase Mo-binding subunit